MKQREQKPTLHVLYSSHLTHIDSVLMEISEQAGSYLTIGSTQVKDISYDAF
jgi:hypothetical protein